MTTDPLIVKVIRTYFPDWEVPKDTGREWLSCLCPWHGDTRPSATVSFVNDAFACFSCGVKGDALKLVMREEGVSYREAVEIAGAIAPESGGRLRGGPEGEHRGRRVFGQQRDRRASAPEVRPRSRRRSFPGA